MSRALDIILFGATGFTGKHAIPLLNKLAKANGRSLTWGVAGRSESKLKEVLAEVEKKHDISLSNVPITIADVEDDASLEAMARKARVIINCCGPYRFLGEQVVKACIKEGTSHVDVSGEPQYMETMQLKYDKEAKEKGIYLVSACGLDSIPTDLGVIFLQNKFDGVLNSVVSYLECWTEGEGSGPLVNYGTWHSAVFGLAYANELKHLRKQLYPKRLPNFSPKLDYKAWPFKPEVIPGWAVPFPGSDRSVVRRSQRFFYENEQKRPVQIETYLVLQSLVYVGILFFFAAIFAVMARFSIGRTLLLKYPLLFSGGAFSHDPPFDDRIENAWFSVDFYGEGWSDKLSEADDVYQTPVNRSITAKVKGRNPGYGSTNICLILAAIMILTEADKMPGNGGVLPPGAAFAKTSIIEQLNENGVTFELLSQNEL